MNEKMDPTSSISSPIHFLLKVYQITDNHGGLWTSIYHYLLITLNVVYMIIVLMETADGPNQYQHRIDEAKFHQLPTFNQYLAIKVTLSLPLIVHCILRLVLAGILNIAVPPQFDHSFRSFFNKGSNYFLSFWFWPILIEAFAPHLWPRDCKALYHVIDFLRHLQIIQSFKEIPSFIVVKETVRRVAKLVPIPAFIFFCFNIFFGVLIFIVDPCFDDTACPFHTLFEAVFFSIVTMTTSER